MNRPTLLAIEAGLNNFLRISWIDETIPGHGSRSRILD